MSVYKYLLTATLVSVALLIPAISFDLFWSIFVVVILVVIANYIGSQHGNKGVLIKSGVFGGVWLIIPWYLHLVSYT